MNDKAVDIHEISKEFDGKVVVEQVSLSIKRGSVFGFLGSNGSGKTTTIRMICGLLTPSSGSGQCLGLDIIKQRDEIKKKIGYMPQKFSLYSRLTVKEHLQFFAEIYEISGSQQAIASIIEDLELAPYLGIKTGDLSGGWKQRLSLACCLLHSPEILFLDEPTAGVDPKARKDFWDYLHKIALRDKTTVLVATHYMDEAEKCTDLAYINLGKLLYSGPTQDLIQFSKVQTFQYDADRSKISGLLGIAEQQYPKLLASLVNNSFRVSSRDKQLLQQFITKQPDSAFQEVLPSFEEVFIGLMR